MHTTEWTDQRWTGSPPCPVPSSRSASGPGDLCPKSEDLESLRKNPKKGEGSTVHLCKRQLDRLKTVNEKWILRSLQIFTRHRTSGETTDEIKKENQTFVVFLEGQFSKGGRMEEVDEGRGLEVVSRLR